MPNEGSAFASEVDKRASNAGIVFDPQSHVPGKPEKGADVGEVLAVGPVADSGDLGVVRDAALIVALVPEDDDFWDCNEKLLGGNGGASTAEAV